MARLAYSTSGLDPTATHTSGLHSLPDCNFLRLLGNSPAALEGYRALEKALAQGRLSRQQRELLALALAEINGSQYCLSAHYALGEQAGLKEEAMGCARKATAVDPQTDALLRFAQAITLQRGELSDADFESLRRAGLTDAQVAEVIAGIALSIFANYFNKLARTEVDFPLLKPGCDKPLPAKAAASPRPL